MKILFSAVVGLMSIVGARAAKVNAFGKTLLYSLDEKWQPSFPSGSHTLSAVAVYNTPEYGQEASSTLVFVTQRGNNTVSPVLVLNATNGDLIDSWGDHAVGIDRSKPPAATWGSHGIAIERCNYPCVSNAPITKAFLRVYVEDFTNHTVTAFSALGEKQFVLGTPGLAGNSTSPLQFGNVADAYIEPGWVGPNMQYGPAYVYAADGDGGTANRVIKVKIPAGDAAGATVEWATPAMYNNPHSIAYHKRSGLLVVADRDDNATHLLRADTGEDLGVWDCGLRFGVEGKPFGVRTLQIGKRDLLFVASMDNPQDGRNQRITILDASGLNADTGAASPCSIIQTLPIDPARYSGPHLLGVDPSNGDVYATLVADSPLSTVLRFKCSDC